MRKMVAGVTREVVWCEDLDYGGMFPGEIGVYRLEERFVAYARDGWGAGVKSAAHSNLEAARKDTERLVQKFFG